MFSGLKMDEKVFGETGTLSQLNNGKMSYLPIPNLDAQIALISGVQGIVHTQPKLKIKLTTTQEKV